MNKLAVISACLVVFFGFPILATAQKQPAPVKDLPAVVEEIPEEELNREYLIPINQYQSSIFFEGVLAHYTKNRIYVVIRYKNPECGGGGKLIGDFYLLLKTPNGYLSSEVVDLKPNQGEVREFTFSKPGYYGPLQQGVVELFSRAKCVLPTAKDETPQVTNPAGPEIQNGNTSTNTSPNTPSKSVSPAPTKTETAPAIPKQSETVPNGNNPPPMPPAKPRTEEQIKDQARKIMITPLSPLPQNHPLQKKLQLKNLEQKYSN